MRFLQKTLLIAAAFCVQPLHAADGAANYPDKPVTLVVPFAAGGTTDVLARMLSQQLTTAWGQPVVVENKPGAGATLGANQVAQAKPDGYMLLVGATHHTIAQNVYRKLPYDFGRDFAPVSVIAIVPNMLVVNANVPAQTVEEFIALARKEPGKLNYGSAGAGTAHHLIGEMFKAQAGVDIVHIPYSGSAPAVSDLVGGRVDLMFDTVTSGLPQVKAGKTRALAVTTAKRSSALPDVPALGEKALPGFDVGTWFGVLAPAGTPPAVIAKLQGEIQKMAQSPVLAKQMRDMGAEPVGNSSADMGKQIQAELASFKQIVEQQKLRVD